MISIVMSTFNGEATLPLTLNAFIELDKAGIDVEFILVNNASTDTTEKILKMHEHALSANILYEPRRGKSFGLNCGIRNAIGDLVVFTDDDVIPSRGWLKAFAAMASKYPEVDLFAGQVRHHWQKVPPKWLERLANEGMSYGGTPISRLPGPTGAESFKGANMMVRRHVLNTFQFCEDGGINYAGQGDSSGGEDTDFVRRALNSGSRANFVPEACIYHIVRADQVAIFPVLKRYFRIGRANAAINDLPNKLNLPMLFGYPRYLFRTIPIEVLRAAGRLATGDSYAAARQLIEVAITCGKAHEIKTKLKQNIS